MPTEVMVFQDSDDIGKGVKLELSEGSGSVSVYFTLAEWQAFKDAVNKFQYVPPREPGALTEEQLNALVGVNLENNPVQTIQQDGVAVMINFVFGELFAELYFENPEEKPQNNHWENFKKQVNDFTPDIVEATS